MTPFLNDYRDDLANNAYFEDHQTASLLVRTWVDGSETIVYPGILLGTYPGESADPSYYYSEREIERLMDGDYWSIPRRRFSVPTYEMGSYS